METEGTKGDPESIPKDVVEAAEYVRGHSATFGEEGYDSETHECSWEESPDYEFEKAAKVVADFVLRLAKKAH